MAFDPATRDRLIARTMVPASVYVRACRYRARFRDRFMTLFDRYDVLIAPTTPDVAPRLNDPTILIGGEPVPARAHLGLYTQPISFIGLPVLAAPVLRPGRLPFGIQLIAAPGREADLFAAAAWLEDSGVTGVSAPVRAMT